MEDEVKLTFFSSLIRCLQKKKNHSFDLFLRSVAPLLGKFSHDVSTILGVQELHDTRSGTFVGKPAFPCKSLTALLSKARDVLARSYTIVD